MLWRLPLVYDIYLDTSPRSGRVMAHLLEPPGLGIRFEDRRALEAGLTQALQAHLEWLSSCGMWEPAEGGPPRWRIVMEQSVEGDFESGDDVGFYPPDEAPLDAGEVERYLAIARRAREELLAIARSLTPAQMEWRRDERCRPIRAILMHVANAELWYMTRLIDDPETHGMPPRLADLDRAMDESTDPVERLVMVREELEHFFRTTPLERLNRVAQPSWYCDVTTERWTGRKALRRVIEHEREHTRSVLATLAAHQVDPGQRALV